MNLFYQANFYDNTRISNEMINKYSTFFVKMNFLALIILILIITAKNQTIKDVLIPKEDILTQSKVVERNLVEDMSHLTKLKDIEDKLNKNSLIGKWSSNNKLFDFENKEGLVRIVFQTFMKESKGPYHNIMVFIHDGHEKKRWILVKNSFPKIWDFKSSIVSDENHLLINQKNIEVNMNEYSNINVLMERYEMLDYNITFPQSFSDKFLKTQIYGNLIGNLYGINIAFFVNYEETDIFLQISNFAIIFTIISFVQLVNSKFLMDSLSRDENMALKVIISKIF